MSPPLDDILRRILELQPHLHSDGTISRAAFAAILRHSAGRKIRESVETGCGATTLLLSHLSQHHTVFALDKGGSVANVRRSPLLKGMLSPLSTAHRNSRCHSTSSPRRYNSH